MEMSRLTLDGSADHEQDWQHYPVDPYSAICDDHTYLDPIPNKIYRVLFLFGVDCCLCFGVLAWRFTVVVVVVVIPYAVCVGTYLSIHC